MTAAVHPTERPPEHWWRRSVRWTQRHPFRFDIAFATVVGALALVGYMVADRTGSQRDQDLWGALLIGAQASSFAFRRRAVWWSLAGVTVCTVAFWTADYPTNVDVFSLLAIYAATVHGGDDRRLVWRRVGAAVIVFETVALVGVLAPNEDLPAIALVGILTLHLTAAFFGEAVYDRQRRMTELQLRADRAETERELLTRQAVAAERARIAREMHDVVAHSMSVVVVQAGAAERALDADPDAAREAMRNIQSVGREALSEMRRVLGVLRDTGEEAGRTPQPGIGQLEQLVTSCTTSGLPTSLEVVGDVPALPASQDIAAYRVVQEALTNTLKHGGGGASAAVRIGFDADTIRIEVVDDGAGTSATDVAKSTGQGIVGMRERVEIFGGSLRAGPRPGGGFRVMATLPIESAPASRAVSRASA